MKRRKKPSHSGAEVAAAPVAIPAPVDNNQNTTDLASQPMTSPHDDTYTATATESAAGALTDESPPAFAADSDSRELFVLPPQAQDDPTLGQRLRAARERRGWSLDEVSTRLRLPQRVVATLENNDFQRIEYDVYLRGYLASYARLLEIPLQTVDSQLRERQAPPPALIATGRISHSRYLFQRYSVPTVYVILTGLIVAPAVWLATHGGLDQNLARLAPLEQPQPDAAPRTPVTLPLDSAAAADPAALAAPVPAEGAAKPAVEQPLMASMVPAIKHEEAVAPPTPALAPGSYEVSLRLKDASWVEVIGADGQRVEFGLLPAGSSKTYAIGQPVSVRLGNSANAELLVNGKSVDLAPFRRAAVAHLKLVDGAAVAPAAAPADN